MSALRIVEHVTAQADFAELARQLYGDALREEPVPATARCFLAYVGTEARARCSLSVAPQLYGVAGESHLIGHYEALDAEAGVSLLREVCAKARARGARRILGPMNGNTWRRYRLALPAQPGDPLGDPTFFLGEPRNPPDYPDHFLAAGLSVVARYESHVETLHAEDATAREARRVQLEARGIRIRPLDPDRFEAELDTLFELSTASFATNLYYSPIDVAAFRALYAPLRPLLDPQNVLIASDAQGPLAFLLCYDMAGLSRIAKSLATLPRARGLGIAGYLMSCARQRALAQGIQGFLYALMHIDNASMHFARREHCRLYRRYALYGWEA